MQETPVRSLILEDPACCGETKPVQPSYWVCALEIRSQTTESTCLQPVFCNKRSHFNKKPAHCTWRVCPLLFPTSEKSALSNRDAAWVKITLLKRKSSWESATAGGGKLWDDFCAEIQWWEDHHGKIWGGIFQTEGKANTVLSHFRPVWLFVTPWTVNRQASLSIGLSRQGYWSGLSFPPPGDLPNPGVKLASLSSPALAGGFFTMNATCETPRWVHLVSYFCFGCCCSVAQSC